MTPAQRQRGATNRGAPRRATAVQPIVPDRCVHCEEPLGGAGRLRVAFAYPASGYVAHLACISFVGFAAMDERLTRYHAPKRVLRAEPFAIESTIESPPSAGA